MNFYLLDKAGRTQCVDCGNKFIRDEDNNYWYVKNKPGSKNEEKRDYLAYLIGKDFANIPEVKLLDNCDIEKIKELKILENANNENTFLVKCCNTYSVSKLPCSDIDSSVARELLYSLWIGRRDADLKNRIYLNNVTHMFFDFQTAFRGECTLLNMNNILSHKQIKSWSIKILKNHKCLETERTKYDNKSECINFISSMDEFMNQVDIVKNILISKNNNLESDICKAGFSKEDSDKIKFFLNNNMKEIDNAVEFLKKIISE